MTIRRITTRTLLLVLFLLVLAACGGQSTPDNAPSSEPQTTVRSETTAQTTSRDNADTVQVRLREPAAGDYKGITRYSIGELPIELTYNMWLSAEGMWTTPGSATMFYVKFFQGGDESFTVVPMAQPSDIVGPFSVKVDFLSPNNFTLTSFSGNNQSSVIGQVCPEGCQVKVDTSLLPQELFPDTTGDYFFFATGWNNETQFAFPMGWAPQP